MYKTNLASQDSTPRERAMNELAERFDKMPKSCLMLLQIAEG